jgi:hypothetical protein
MDIQNARAELIHPPKVPWWWLGAELATVVGLGLLTFVAALEI